MFCNVLINIYIPSYSYFHKYDSQLTLVGVVQLPPSFDKFLNNIQNNILTLPKLSTNMGNSIIDLTRNQSVDVNNVTDIFSVDLNTKIPTDFQNINMAFFADVDDVDVIVTWTEGNNLYIGERNEIRPGPNMSYAFSNSTLSSIECNRLKSVNLADFNTSNVTDMSNMFSSTGKASDVFTLNLGSKFNTINVTNMRGMFWQAGFNSTVFTLNLGSHFHTSKVTGSMAFMFSHAGQKSTDITLDLGSHFNTSQVVNMYAMFSNVGCNNDSFTLDLGSHFNTSKITNMQSMFHSTGKVGSNFTLNLNSFTINNSFVDLTHFAYGSGFSNLVFGTGWVEVNMSTINFYRLSLVNVYYTDTSFLTTNLANMNYWNAWRGVGNTTFIQGLP
ncbi:MAG: BspA family leucine-rich repeat surface protein [Mollicutes bacterium]|nr:BspA family leucine-rich repeat surface protein [Mollicutes bacterium]